MSWGPTPVSTLASSCQFSRCFTAIAADESTSFACALENNGAVWCWDTEWCRDELLPSLSPHRVGGSDFRATRIVVGANASCGLTDLGAVYCWSDDDARRSDDASVVRVALPARAVELRMLPGSVENPGTLAYVLLDDGRILRWTSSPGGVSPVLQRTALQKLPTAAGHADTGVCEQDSAGRVRCRGTTDSLPMQGGYPHGALPLSDGEWRLVPYLFGASELGADAFCGWGVIGDHVRVECAYGPGANQAGFGCQESGTCLGWALGSYVSPRTGSLVRTESFEYRASRVKRLPSFDFVLDDTGHCFRLFRGALVEACRSTYVDIVGDMDRTGLTTRGQVRQSCHGHAIDDGTLVTLP